MHISFTDILLIVVIILLLVNMIVIFVRTGGQDYDELLEEQKELIENYEHGAARRNAENMSEIRRDIDARISYDAEENRRNRTEVADMISRNSAEVSGMLSRNQEKMELALKTAVGEMQEANRAKLEDIQADLNQKLDTSLNDRLDASFKTVGDQLNKLYVSLGELARLENGVNSLNRTLSNVKTRGIYGEMQLENILHEILPGTLFDKNVVTKTSVIGNRDAVEFAVRIPDKEINGAFMYLPIDSKFPTSYYDRIGEASEQADAAEMKKAIRDLEARVKLDARNICDKYIDPPNTTDFGIMFLPVESLYAEVLRIPGLVEECQSRYHVVITGPSTMAALLNSLSIGFRYMAVNKDSQNILKLLGAIKTQYATLSKLIDTAGTRIESAKKANDELQHRADIINRKLSAVEEMDPLEADMLLSGVSTSRREITEDFLD